MGDGRVLAREIGVTLLRFWVIRRGVLAASRGGKVKTLLQAVAIGLYLLPLTGRLASLRAYLMAGRHDHHVGHRRRLRCSRDPVTSRHVGPSCRPAGDDPLGTRVDTRPPEREGDLPVKAEIVAIGTELLLGDIVNGNAAWLGRELADIGIDVDLTTAVGDNIGRISAAVGHACERADVVRAYRRSRSDAGRPDT